MNAGLMRRINNIRKQGDGGFTLVELIVVLVVLGILCTLAVMSIIGWQDYADFKRNNEAAKSIFVAAQTQLTQYGERGQLTDLISLIADDGKDPSSYLLQDKELKNEDGTIILGDIWEKFTGKEERNTGNIYYLMAEKGDYKELYSKLKSLSIQELKSSRYTAQDRRVRALFDLIEPYIADKSMLDAAICLEFDPNPKTALVYSVFYNDKVKSFTYEENTRHPDEASIYSRRNQDRREKKTGYYGVENMARGTDTFISKPVITEFRLNNKETLNLSWKVLDGENRSVDTTALTSLLYTITLHDMSDRADHDGKPIAQILLGSADDHIKTGLTECTVYFVTGKDVDGNYVYEKGETPLLFPVTYDSSEGTLTLVLDGLDLSADETKTAEELKHTASVRRLVNMPSEAVNVTIIGRKAGVYDTTTPRRSNTEHPYLAGREVKEDGVVLYSIDNMRHFNNIRYMEADRKNSTEGSATVCEYQLLRGMNWKQALLSGFVYENLNAILDLSVEQLENYYFKPFLRLGKYSTLTSADMHKAQTIGGIALDIDHMQQVAGETDGIPEGTVGLFVVNKGTVKNLIFSNLNVNGIPEDEGDLKKAAAAGGVCGQNEGFLENLTILNEDDGSLIGGTSSVAGVMNVGGFTGMTINREADVIYQNLENRAMVTGQVYVGGIAGDLNVGKYNIVLDNCVNYGKITGKKLRNDFEDAYFLGGIAGSTGYREGYQKENAGIITIKNCKSSPYYTAGEKEPAENPEAAENVLVGDYVGGIVGYNDGAEIEACSTVRESTDKQGYVAGRNYVGGIVGYNSGNTGLNIGTDNRNQAYVNGYSYVGGIVGCNAIGKVVADEENGVTAFHLVMDPKESAGEKTAHVKGWINEGIITAAGDYAGGITGYNGDTGCIENSYSNVEYDGSHQNISDVSSTARFAGGIAGYNGGQITNKDAAGQTGTTAVSVVSVVHGRDYVGGVVGFNDIGGTIENYSLQGGYISGKRFVGGFIGLNLERSIFESHILSNPNEIKGDYFVGGIIGGNLIPVEDDEDTILYADFRTDNFLGTLSADNGAFAGGFIGYNYLLKGSKGSEALTGERILTEAEAMIHMEADGREIFSGLPDITTDVSAADVTMEMAPVEEAVENFLSEFANEKASLVIQAVNTTSVQEKLGGVTGRVYVGGVIGYNQRATKMQIHKVENISPVEATGYIVRVEGLDAEEKKYSYAGGIIGKVEENVLLYACRNKDIGTVRAKGTYTGGLAEVNYGTLQDCITGSIGDNTMDYVGGLVGVNAARKKNEHGGETDANLTKGQLLDCLVSGQITGRSYVGGLAAENYGIIRYGEEPEYMPALSSDKQLIEASGFYAGGLAGYAHKTSRIELKTDTPFCISVHGTASVVGGIAGANAGSMIRYGVEDKRDQILNARGRQEDNTDEEGTSIIGHRHVGGFIGVQMKTDQNIGLSYFKNNAYVRATTGYAGGVVAIVAYSGDKSGDGDLIEGIGNETDISGSDAVVTISDCENNGLVEVLSEDGDDEQELEPEDGIIESLKEYPVAAGGITAVNFGKIDSCKNVGEVRANSGYMGGIAAVNFHVIQYSEVGNLVAADQEPSNTLLDTLELSGSDAVGGIAAVNEDGGIIRDSVVRRLILRNQSESRSSDMGGIAGRNGVDEPANSDKAARIENCFVGIALEASELKSSEKADYSVWRSEAANYVSNQYVNKKQTFQENESETVGNSVVLISNAPDVNMGGVAGLNEGKVHGKQKGDYQAVAAADLKFFGDSLSYFGNMGGIVGYNTGSVKHYEFSGFVSGSANDPSNTPSYNTGYDLEQSGSLVYGYGGIVGKNGSDRQSNTDVTVESCFLGMAKIQGTGDSSNRTNVGGVAGFNGKGAVISDIIFSQNKVKQSKEETTSTDETGVLGIKNAFTYTENGQTYTGTVWVNATVCGHIGGVAGYNHGTITGINWSGMYEQNRQEKWVTEEGRKVYRGYFGGGVYDNVNVLADVDGTGAFVTTSAGHIGGIVGYNRRTGSISHAVTGRNWLVCASAQEQDNGAGGIIGYNISEQDLVSCDNHATVVKRITNSNAVGGMVGRNENSTTSSWRFYDCHNYGDITGAARVGGMIGNWKYRGGTLEACLNFGKIRSIDNKGSAHAGGLAGMFYGFAAGETVNMVNCENHGTIGVDHAGAAGGFVGYLRPDVRISLNLYNGINTGTIDNTGVAGGFIGDGSTKTLIQNCRNYGYGSKRSSEFKGITADNKDSLVEIKNSFGVTDIRKVNNPISSNESFNAGGFYFSETGDEVKPQFWVSKIQALGSDIRYGELLYNIVSNTTSSNAYFQSGTKGTLVFEFSRPVYSAEIELEWFVDSGARTYTYKIEYLEDGNPTWIPMGENTGGDYVHDFPENVAISAICLSDISARIVNANANAALEKLIVKGKVDPNGDFIEYIRRPSNASYDFKSSTTEANYSWEGPIIVEKKGKALQIFEAATANEHVAESADGNVSIPLGGYTLEDIRDESRYTDSAESWKLCKGTAAKEGLDGYLKIESPGTEELTEPTGLQSTPSGGDYLIRWNGDDSTDYYVVTCTYSTGDIREYRVYGKAALMPSALPDGKVADGATVMVTAYRGTESKESDVLEITFGKTLPYPQIRWELENIGQYQYRVVLANQEEYEAFALENGIDLNDITIKTNNPSATSEVSGAFVEGKTIGFTASDGGKRDKNGNYILYGSSDISNKVFTSYAEYDKTQGNRTDIQNSAKVLRESMYPTENNYKVKGKSGERFATVVLESPSTGKSEIGFSGKTIAELEYKISMARNDNYVADFRSEIVADDPNLQVPVALTVSKQTKISTTTNEPIIVQLGNLPTDFLEKNMNTKEDGATEGENKYRNVMVRAYPTKMSNDIVYQGWEVSSPNEDSSYSAEDLKALKVTDSGRIDNANGSWLISEDGSGNPKLKEGYVIERVGDNQYTLYFNTLLKVLLEGGKEDANAFEGFDDLPEWNYNDLQSFMKYQIFYHKIDLDSALGDKVQPRPAVYANAVYDKDADNPDRSVWQNGIYDDDGSITLTWDQLASDGKPAYTNEDGKEPYAADAVYILNLNGIVRDINGAEKTTVLVNNMTISTNSDEKPYNSYSFDAATVRKWNFTEIRGTLTRVGKVNEETHVTTMFPSTTEISLPLRRRLPQMQNVNISLQKKDGVVMKDALDYVVTYHDLAAAGAIDAEIQALDYYLVTIQSKTNAERKLEVRSTSAEADVSLREMFDREEQIMITVKAVAKKDSAEYRDGSESATLEMQVPNWLIPPQMGTPEGGTGDNMTELDHVDSKSIEEFIECSMKLHMEKENYATNVNYQIAIELYNSETDAADGKNPLTEANVYLPGRDDASPTHMDYDSTRGYTYSLKGLPVQYAGNYIRVILRARGNGSISSVWTDEQSDKNMSPGEEKVTEFMIFKLPDVQVDAVELTEGAKEPGTYPVFVNGQELVEDGRLVEVIATQYSVQFQTVAYADDYRITMIQSGQYADKKASPSDAEEIGYMVQDVNEMTLMKKSDTEYELQFQTTEHDSQGKAIQASILLEVDGGRKELPYAEPVVVQERTGEGVTEYAYIELKSYVELTAAEDDAVQVSFVLPDCLEVRDTDAASSADPLKENLNLIDQILVQSVAKQKLAGEILMAQGRYRDSDWAYMNWDGGGFERNDSIQMDDAAHRIQEPVSGVSEEIPVTATANDNSMVMIHDVLYYLEDVKGLTRYAVSISDSSGKEIGIYSVPYTEDSVWGEMGQQVWFPIWDYTEYAQETVRLRFRSIFPAGTGGISTWSEKTYEVFLPELPLWAETELTQSLSESRQYSVQVNSSSRTRRSKQNATVTKMLEAKQYQVTWDYDLGDTSTAGYDLTIHGENMDSDYHLKIDLTRGWYGSIPGLEEYLSEDGKVLYAVAYDLNGDILPYLTGETVATASNSDVATASNSEATPSDYGGQPGVLSLECRLKAEYEDEVVHFTLTLPDASFASLKGSLKENYQDAFDDGLYQTEKILVSPVAATRHFPLPEREWFYLDKHISDEADGGKTEEDSEDLELHNDLK